MDDIRDGSPSPAALEDTGPEWNPSTAEIPAEAYRRSSSGVRFDPRKRSRRGWTMLVATVLVPGSAQILTGQKRLARIGLVVTGITWALALLAVFFLMGNRTVLLGVGTNPLLMWPLLVWLLVMIATWLLCLFETIRQVKVVTMVPKHRPVFLASALALALVVAGGLGWASATLFTQARTMSQIFASGMAKRPVDGRYNIALLGSDAGKGRTGIRPDSLSVFSVDASTGKVVTVGLPRNMENVPFPEDSPLHELYPNGYDCGDECLLNAVYQLGEQNAELFDGSTPAGAQATMQAMEGATGLEVQYYAMIDLEGFEQLIDAMGGIDLVSGVRVPVSSKVDPTTGEHGPVKEWIEPGELHLDGFHALWYARSRETSSDYERMIRQRCVQQAMISQLDPQTVVTNYQALAEAAPDVISTDIPQMQVSTFLDLALKAKSREMDSLNLTPPRITPSDPDFDRAHALVAEEIENSEKTESDSSAEAAAAAGASVSWAGTLDEGSRASFIAGPAGLTHVPASAMSSSAGTAATPVSAIPGAAPTAETSVRPGSVSAQGTGETTTGGDSSEEDARAICDVE